MSIKKKFPEALFERIADNLSMQDFAVVEDVFSDIEQETLRQELFQQYEHGTFKAAGIGNKKGYQQNTTVRGDHIHWVERDNTSSQCHFFFDLMDALSEYLNRTCYLGIRSRELHFAMYPPGAFYKRHLDVFQNTKARKISVVCYLNKDWQEKEGGQLRLYIPTDDGLEKTIELLPFGGRLVCFRSDLLEHEVLPATRERLTITGWLKNENNFPI
ncbi:MAG: 2OG-Fe(II) oxygenase [Saprospiraceae bacterium]|nr:2OG-Fe(II) oxygenase [Saprospiraceae bacterium]